MRQPIFKFEHGAYIVKLDFKYSVFVNEDI